MLIKEKGFTILNLMIFVAIIGILVYFSIPAYTSLKATSEDKAYLIVLNSATQFYALQEDIQSEDIFTGLVDDKARLEKLLDSGLIDKIPVSRDRLMRFRWDIEEQKWTLHNEKTRI